MRPWRFHVSSGSENSARLRSQTRDQKLKLLKGVLTCLVVYKFPELLVYCSVLKSFSECCEVAVLANGIKDNWSQVRYAASVAARAFNDKAADF